MTRIKIIALVCSLVIAACSATSCSLQKNTETKKASIKDICSEHMEKDGDTTQAQDMEIDIDEQRLTENALELIASCNCLRVEENMEVLQFNDKLMEAAKERARELAVSFSNTRPDGHDGKTIVTEYIPTAKPTSESIISCCETSSKDMKTIFNTLRDDKKSKARMLNANDKYMGVGLYYDYKNGYKYTYISIIYCNDI